MPSYQLKKSRFLKLSLLFSIVTVIIFCSTRLVFAPVPWPDGSAFYLPALELVSWPPLWRMHAQAAFVPSYDHANFNLMPALPLLLGIISKLGLLHIFSAPLLIKVISALGLAFWAWLLGRWIFESTKSIWIATWIGLAGLWDPITRWGTLVVRTETWVGLCWVFIVRELWKMSQASEKNPRSFWKISAGLALAAYFHFEAIVLVPGVALALLPKNFNHPKSWRVWIQSLWKVGYQTTLFLSPWLIYVLLHFSLFLEQMQTQFFRLAGKNGWIANTYLLFHSLFLEHGSPEGSPKFFNLAKGLFWLLLIFLSVTLVRNLFPALTRRPTSGEKAPLIRTLPTLSLGTAVTFWASFYLWCTKAEVWFVALCHFTFWPWLGSTLLDLAERKKKMAFAFALQGTAIFAVLSIASTWVQNSKIQPEYNWETYHKWITCLDRQIQSRVSIASPKIWQPYIPDVLVELSSRHPSYDLTRALDFSEHSDRALNLLNKIDVLLLTTYFNHRPGAVSPHYEGPSRPEDFSIQKELPFGVNQPGSWTTQICQEGPFWAAILVKQSLPKH